MNRGKLAGAILYIALSASLMSAVAQNKPVLGTIPNDTIYLGTGTVSLPIPGIDDGEATIDQTISVSAVSSSSSILTADSVQYTSGNKTAIMYVTEKGIKGSVDITITVTDPDGSTTGIMKVVVAGYNNPGIRFEAHDAVFWQEVIPLKNNPVYSRTLTQAKLVADDLNFNEIPITVNQDCKTRPPCTGGDFYTQFYKGYLSVPTTGQYTFYIEGQDAKGLWFSLTDKFEQATPIVADYTSKTDIGTSLGSNTFSSNPISLSAGKIYAFYATHWVIHTQDFAILWSGPGITKSVIPGTNLMPTYSAGKPGAPLNLQVSTKGNDFVRVSWNKASATASPSQYCIYVNGIKKQTTTDTVSIIQGLTTNTFYSFFVTAADVMEKESFPSNIVNATTYNSDNTPPLPPTQITNVTVSDLAFKIRWSGAKDNETVVTSYNIYVNGTLFNASAPCFEDSIIIKNLKPSTVYQIEIAAVDAGKNVSVRSAPHSVSTLGFDPMAPELGMKKATISLSNKAIANSYGFGINAPYGPELYDASNELLLNDLKPSLIRWGALPANVMSFSDNSGAGKGQTYAKFLKYANDNNYFCEITTGISDETDWKKDTQTFAHFIEYLNGPSTSTYGAIRAQEGITEPLMKNCRGLIIEIGCEVWGGSFHNAQIGDDYNAYATWTQQVTTIIKKSPYYDSTKMFIAYSGRNPSWPESYGLHEKLMTTDSGKVDMLTVAGYLGGNMNYDAAIAPGKSEGDYYKDGFFRMFKNITALKTGEENMKRMTGEYKPTYFYESNMTTPPYNGRLGQAITMVDYMASAVEWGSVLPTIFCLKGGEWKIVREEENNRKLPLYTLTKMYNRFCKGLAISGKMTSQGFLVNASKAKYLLEPVGCHFYNDSDSFTVMVSSRDFENDYTVQLNFDIAVPANTIARKYVATGTGFSTIDVAVDSSEIPLANGTLVSVPKHSIVFVTFKAQGLGTKLPFGYYEPGRTIGVGIKEFLEINRSIKTDNRNSTFKVFDLRGKYIGTYRAADMKRLPAGVLVYRNTASAGSIRKQVRIQK